MENYKKTIVIFGCTGTVGLPILQLLIKDTCIVRGVLRNPQREHPISLENTINLSYVSADLSIVKEVEDACKFADTIFLLTATHPKQEEYETNVINAAKKYGVKRIVKLSAPDIEPVSLVEVSNWHRKIEGKLEDSGIEFCCLRPQAFMQNWERNTFTIRRFGKIYGAMENAPRNYVDARDVAEIAVKLLLQNTPLELNYISISGPEAITNYDMAERLTRVTNTNIEYLNISSNELFRTLKNRAKLPEWLANHIVELDELAIKMPEPTEDSTEKLLNKKPRLMNAYLQESKELFKRKPIWKL
ncbi:NAD(P)H-binding protein [Aquimarina muelleri]|uniref:NAD(P)-dependent oxidoreductase n=1 Tax=Aquimarina muelleri TaxID=279356 RepID=A0A918JYU2_9FLAO|nr:NAD(P)H-binding protein [Aquimarina muelleri]MCX2763831.1 NAD(P)H-binding protein [Aquimarina muelleri]GGX29417.1 NAD(P)-dependent oxidoreductase [Aquimarina muelleri]